MTRRLPVKPAPGPLEEYAARFDDPLGARAQREGFRRCLKGLLLPAERNKTLTALANTLARGRSAAKRSTELAMGPLQRKSDRGLAVIVLLKVHRPLHRLGARASRKAPPQRRDSRAQTALHSLLLKADAYGSDRWTDERIADAFEVSTATVAPERQRYCEDGLQVALMPKKRL
jgi:hypothetical protein